MEIKKNKKTWVFIFSFIFISLIWEFWSLFFGAVPIPNKFRIMEKTTITFPFPISRRWDALFISACLYILMWGWEKAGRKKQEDEKWASILATILMGLIIGIIEGTGAGIVVIIGASIFASIWIFAPRKSKTIKKLKNWSASTNSRI